MRVLLQRVSKAAVRVDEQTVGAIDHGLLLLAGIGHGDDEATVTRMADKVARLRIFNDHAGKFNLSLLDVGGAALVVSQFTLFADARKGRRPSYTDAGSPAIAEPLVQAFGNELLHIGVPRVAYGIFGAHMHIEIHNDGPVTIWLDSAEWASK
jgi:D-tyrosyl-tRNA(Tyr) deacylase